MPLFVKLVQLLSYGLRQYKTVNEELTLLQVMSIPFTTIDRQLDHHHIEPGDIQLTEEISGLTG